jgi:hypothetical protein
MKLFNVFVEQFQHTMAIVGVMVTIVYIMRHFGFNDPLPWQYVYYPACVIGLFLGFVLKKYYQY